MTSSRNQKIQTVAGIVLTAATFLLGAAFIVCCLQVYEAGYSRELVGEKLRFLCLPVCLWILFVIASFLLSVLFPVAKKALPYITPRDSLRRLSKRTELSAAAMQDEKYSAIKKLALIRMIAWSATALFCVAVAIIAVVYLRTADHFHTSDLIADAVALLVNVMTWVFAAFLLCCGATVVDGVTVKKQTALTRELVKAYPDSLKKTQGAQEEKSERAERKKRYLVAGIRAALLVVGIVFVIVGTANGGMADVLKKAIAICTECIGLG